MLITYRAEDHNARECPEPRNAATVECRKCNQSQSPNPNSFFDVVIMY